MAKKNVRKSGGAAGIAVIDEAAEDMREQAHDEMETAIVERPAAKTKKAPAQAAGDQVAVSDIKKAAAFANSVGGLDKAITVLQILKVAKEVQ